MPSHILQPSFTFDKLNYQSGDTVNVDISLMECERCISSANYNLILNVIDYSALLQVNQQNVSASLITKVFLEKQIYRESGELLFWNEYIDTFFTTHDNADTQKVKLDLLLGVQKER